MEKYLKACKDFGIAIYVGDSNQAFDYGSCDDFIGAIEGTQGKFSSSPTLCATLGIAAGRPWFSFQVTSLCSMSESSYQANILSPLSLVKGTYCIDTHSSNRDAKYLSVSPVKDRVISFDALPDCTMACGPVVLEVKSRKNAKGHVVSTAGNSSTDLGIFSNLSIGAATTSTRSASTRLSKIEDDAKAALPLLTVDWSIPERCLPSSLTSLATTEEDSVKLCSFDSVQSVSTACAASSDNTTGLRNTDNAFESDIASSKLITLTEIDLLQQSLERVLEHSQFRAYLSKFIVIASTGFASFCFLYTQGFDSRKEKHFKSLRIMLITSENVDDIWCGILDQIGRVGKKYFLTEQAPLIFRTLAKLCPAYDLHSIRVHVASVSRSTVYFITLPEKKSTVYQVSTVKRDQSDVSFAFKVVMDVERFANEVSFLKKLACKWNDDGRGNQFYYRGFFSDSGCIEIAPGHTIFQSSKANKAICCYNWIDVPYENSPPGGVIIMRQGSRVKIEEVIQGNNDKIYSELLDSLTLAHDLGIHHRDIRPANCLCFGDTWQLIDFDMAATASTDGTSSIILRLGDHQYECAGYNIKLNANTSSVQVQWTYRDDLEMLHKTCCG